MSCNNEKVEKEYYNTGQLLSEFYLENGKKDGLFRSYYKNGKLKVVHNYKNDKRIDSSIYYYKQPKQKVKLIEYIINDSIKKLVYYDSIKPYIERKGKYLSNTIFIGKWSFYKNNKLDKIIEFKKINNDSHINQDWYYDDDGKLIGGNHFQLIHRDTTLLKEELNTFLNLVSPYFKRGTSKIVACISNSDTVDFNFNFSNEEKMKLACYQDFNTLKRKRKIAYLDYNYVTEVSKKFKTPGKKIVKGIIYEYLIKDRDSLGLEAAIENARKMYFEIPVFVKDSV
ncbi:MAG: hypothetical protein V3V28_05910 [Polaribacter sp.]|uniref:toxin-antitoxin system YwqK family antitoxin n=1 Tax=Polaribacter sp. TaxID=1920175 RepID=UPI002F35F9F7